MVKDLKNNLIYSLNHLLKFLELIFLNCIELIINIYIYSKSSLGPNTQYNFAEE